MPLTLGAVLFLLTRSVGAFLLFLANTRVADAAVARNRTIEARGETRDRPCPS